ncbi:LysR family transcriptional regulator [Luteibacter sp. OK325]|uniref:LysR family transcriptional regulator n=1 Tax=Luteibacter sp. OK325 TaxID=2135670 RepID=UPI000D3ACD13|nr:LysR family transcriptional regulator [Luteibacter sp. OK325]PTR30769.1 LysR family transcriptional regulator [Luteibacter sp. OK325]
MDRLEAMRVFVHVVDAGSLSGAARALDMPLPTVSRRLSDLERRLKTQLITRSTRQLTLTDSGLEYVTTCRRILEEIEQAERQAAGEYAAPKGDLVITAPIVFGRMYLLPIVTEFLKAYPEINVRLVLGDRSLNLLEDHVDLAVRIGTLPDSSLIATRLGTTRRVVCGSPAYFAEKGTPQHPRELRDHACVTFEGLDAATQWLFSTGKTSLAVPIQSRLAVSTAEAAIDAAVAGVGVTRVIAYQVAARCRDGILKQVLEDFEPEAWPISMLYAGQGRLPLKARAFLDFTGPRLRSAVSIVP